MRKIVSYTILLGATFSWLVFLWPPVEEYSSKGNVYLGQIISDLILIDSPIYPHTPFAGYLFLLVALAPIAVLVVFVFHGCKYVFNAFEPISILESKFSVVFSGDMSRSTTGRVQRYLANRHHLNAYQWTSSVNSPIGEIDLASLRCASSVDNESITDDLLIFGNKSKLECIEIFRKPLPVSIAATVLPNSAVSAMHKYLGWFSKSVITRSAHFDLVGEYTKEQGDFRVIFGQMVRQSPRLEIKLDFPAGGSPNPEIVRAFEFRENFAKKLVIQHSVQGDRCHFDIIVPRLPPPSAVRVIWKQPKSG